MNNLNIALFGTSANPPTYGHLSVINDIINLKMFDIIIVRICGTRMDKYNSEISPHHRATMMNLLIPSDYYLKDDYKLFIDYRDLYKENTPTLLVMDQLSKEFSTTNITFCTGDDININDFYQGSEIITKYNVRTFTRNKDHFISSTTIREKIKEGCSKEQLNDMHITTSDIIKYIFQNNLYMAS